MRSITTLLTVLLLGVSFGHSISKRETNINDLIDDLVKDANSFVVAAGQQFLSVGDFSATFEKKVRFFKLKGSFTACDGVVGDLSTLQRTGDATLTSTPTTISIALHLGLRHLEVYYRNYEASFEKIRVSGDMRATMETNSLFVQLTFVYEDEDSCSMRVDGSSVEALEGIRVEVSNLGPLRWISEKVAEWAARRFREDVEHKVEDWVASVEQRNRNGSLCEFVRNI